jgi:hypothetical protein
LLDRSDVSNPVSITGSACTFEANVAWELTQGGDALVLVRQLLLAACPDRSDWSIDLGELAPGNYVLTVSDSRLKMAAYLRGYESVYSH